MAVPAPASNRRVIYGNISIFTFLLYLLAFLFFLLATLLGGHVIKGSGLGWFLPAGLATLVLAWLVP